MADETLKGDADSRDEKLDFNHPYQPYDVQDQFMRAAYSVLEAGQGQVGLLESPTGTVSVPGYENFAVHLETSGVAGPFLRRKCGRCDEKHKSSRHTVELEKARESFQDEPSWLREQLLRRKREELFHQWEESEQRLKAIREKEAAQISQSHKRRRIEEPHLAVKQAAEYDDDWLPQTSADRAVDADDALSGLSKEGRELLMRIGLGGTPLKPQDEGVFEDNVKIFYTSRTHSQLSQFIGELRRPRFPSSMPLHSADDPILNTEGVKSLPLSSRQRLCINPSVSRLGSAQAINDRCADLQQQKAEKRCPFLPSEELLAKTHHFRDTALATMPDIEDLHQLGKSLKVCPYYASRTVLPGAEVIVLPYPLLLQKSARDALGIKLDGNVVIIDEAHNIMDAISNVYAAELRLSELRKARSMLSVYVKRFGKRLKGENRVNVGQIGRVVDGLTGWLEQAETFKEEYGIVNSNDLMRKKGIDQIDLFGLIQYVHESKLAYKIESYSAHVEQQEENSERKKSESSGPVLHSLVYFLIALTNHSSEGRIFYQKLRGPPKEMQLSYLLLSPTHAFDSIVSSARSVILAGGTMSPFEDYRMHLFPSLATSKVTTLSCGHVIPKTNICVTELVGGRPGSPAFYFSFQRRSDKNLINELGLATINLCAVVPDGMVVFFPSYNFLDEVVEIWQQRPSATPSVWERLQARKFVFREVKGQASEEILEQYSTAIYESAKRGALLLSVVGGKMSEGINFSDRLGRCVMIVGLPYPNPASPVWKAKTEYAESTMLARLQQTNPTKPQPQMMAEAKQAGRDLYEDACMRAVNQSIGRAIRHRGDYAAIILADRRYGSERIRSKLSGWIREAMAPMTEVGEVSSHGRSMLGGVMGALGSFYRRMAIGNGAE